MELREVKQRFFALRNGLLADMLRKQCQLPHKVIFGLNLPQIKQIAAEAGINNDLAAQLWADTDVRESRLLAPMLRSADTAALEMLLQVRSVEEADVLCHSLLRRCPKAEDAAIVTLKSPDPLIRYAALRLLLNLWPASSATLRNVLRIIPFHPITDGIVRQISREIEDVETL